MNYILTNHAEERINQRKIPMSFVDKTLNNPDQKIISNDGSIKLRKNFGTQTTTAIIKTNDKHQSVVLSFWVDPPIIGSMDYKNSEDFRKMKKAGNIKKLFLIMKRQIGF